MDTPDTYPYYKNRSRSYISEGPPRIKGRILAWIVNPDLQTPKYFNYCCRLASGNPGIPCVCQWCIGESSGRYAWSAPHTGHVIPVMSRKRSPAAIMTSGHVLQTNTPEFTPSGLQDFGTPRPANTSKAKVIHKEKLSTLKPTMLQGNNMGMSSNSSMCRTAGSIGVSRGDMIPTAHVSPNPASTRHGSTLYTSPSSEVSNLRRTSSTSNFTDIQRAGVAHHEFESMLPKNSSTRRWSSYQELAGDEAGCELQQLAPDTDVTINDSCFHDPDTKYIHEKLNTQTQSPRTSQSSSVDMQYHDPRLSAMTAPPHTLHYTGNYGGNDTYKSQHYHSSFQTPSPHIHTPAEYRAVDGYRLSSTGSVSTQPMGSDITYWQKKHQEELMVQRLEATRPAVYTGLESMTTPTYLDPHRLDAVKQAADSIIREKDKIIEKQKTRMMQLELRVGESEFDLHKAHMYNTDDSTALNIQYQETQYENARLKGQLAEFLNSKTSGVGGLEKRLGSTEYELRELKQVLDKERQQRGIELKSMQDLLGSKDGNINSWKEKYNAAVTERDNLEKKLESMGRYLGDLPTMDDHAKRTNDMRQLEKDKSKYKSRAQELERRLAEAGKAVRQRQELVERLEETGQERQETIKQLQDENTRLRESLGLEQDGQVPLTLQEQLEELRFENERRKSEMEKARKLLEAKHKKQQSIEVRHRGEVKDLEERLSHQESAVTGLKDELSSKDQLIRKLKESLKEMAVEKEDLLASNSSLEERQQELEKELTGEAHKLETRLLKEMAVCFAELQSLVQICVQRAEGEDPNISALLGAKGVLNLEPDETQPVGDNVQSLKYKVSKIRDLRKDIDNLRDIISNKYAEDMGENLNCTTQ